MDRALAWTVSLGAHAALVLALLLALGRGHGHDRPLAPPPRLVWVEPAPPAAAPLGAGGRPAASEAPPAPRRARGATRLVDRPRRPAASPAPQARPTAAPAIPPGPGTASGAAGGRGSAPAGTRDGIADGVVAGRGDAPRALASVARPPTLRGRVTPEYPARARARGIEGEVVLEVIIDRAGAVEHDIRVLRSVAGLDAAAVAAVRRWRFAPARDHAGRPVRVIMEIPLRFVLR